MNIRAIPGLVKATVNAWLDDRAMSLAASLAFYTLLSIAPLLVLAVSVAGFIFGESAARGEIAQQLRSMMGNDAGAAVESILAHTNKAHANVAGTLVGLIVLFLGASGVFAELQDSLNAIWKVKPRPGRALVTLIRARFVSFAMVLGVAFLLLVSLLVSAALNIAGAYLSNGLPGGAALWVVINFAVSFVIIAMLFSLIFKVVPDATIRFRDVWHGGVFTALLFVVGKTLIGVYLGKAGVASPYGAAGSLVVLVVWVYYSAQILFLGAEFTRVYAHARGTDIMPNANAISTASASHAHATHPVGRFGESPPAHGSPRPPPQRRATNAGVSAPEKQR